MTNKERIDELLDLRKAWKCELRDLHRKGANEAQLEATRLIINDISADLRELTTANRRGN